MKNKEILSQLESIAAHQDFDSMVMIRHFGSGVVWQLYRLERIQGHGEKISNILGTLMGPRSSRPALTLRDIRSKLDVLVPVCKPDVVVFLTPGGEYMYAECMGIELDSSNRVVIEVSE